MSKFRRVASVAIVSLFAFAISVAVTEARNGRGGGVAHVGGGGVRAGGGAHIGGSAFRGSGGAAAIRGGSFRGGPALGGSFSHGGRGYGPIIGSSPNVRSVSGFRSAPRSFTSRGYARSVGSARGAYRIYTGRALGDGRVTARSRQLGTSALAMQNVDRRFSDRNRNLVTGSVRGVGRTSVLRNDAFASSSRLGRNQALRHASFHGGFAGKHWNHGHGGWHWRHHHPVAAIGWFGPVFWPYAYWDFVDYTFWPYAYDAFWPYAYDDVYVGIFGPYAYEGPAYASLPPSSRRARTARRRSATETVVCNAQAPALTDWPIQQITQTVQPNEAQQAALNELKDATAKAVSALQSACPDDLPSTPTGRLAAMQKRTSTMMLAVSIVQPPLQRFYESLSDEQKARFNVIDPKAQAERAPRGDRPADISQVCGEQAIKAASVPIERITKALNPNDIQRSALNALNDATTKAADFLKANCPAEQALTPPARVAAIEQRLKVMLEAINIVQPALDRFYASLTDEQKARFNLLGSPQG